MTTLTGRSNTALLVVDMQNDIMSGVYNRDAVVANISLLIDKARAENVPVVWVQHSGEDVPIDSQGWQFIPELSHRAAEPVVPKRYADSFEETDLESVLDDHHIGRLIVAGAQTDECIRATLHGAIVRGYDATLVSDAHSTEDLTPWGAPQRQGHRPHQPLLAEPRGAWKAGGNRDDGVGRLRRIVGAQSAPDCQQYASDLIRAPAHDRAPHGEFDAR